MELRVQNIGKIENARIEINGVTVITGYNSTGKSSVCKALYSIMDAYSNMDRKIFSQRRSSMLSAVSWWEEQICESRDINEDILDIVAEHIRDIIYDSDKLEYGFITVDRLKELCREYGMDLQTADMLLLIDKLYEIIDRDKEEYVQFIVSQRVKSIFRNQIGHVNFDKQSIISLCENNKFCKVVFEKNELIDNERPRVSFKKPIYMEPESVLDSYGSVRRGMYIGQTNEPIRSFLTANEIAKDKLTLEQYQEREKNIKLVKEILDGVTKGHLVKKQDMGLTYVEQGLQEDIVCKNIASGLKPFLIIQRMVENGSLEAGRLLIIDEPEVNLHPAWQLKFAKVLVLLHTELKVQVVISTHSPYFLKAVDYYMEEQGKKENGKYYLTRGTSHDLYTLEDVTEDKEKIYKTMYAPLEEMN